MWDVLNSQKPSGYEQCVHHDNKFQFFEWALPSPQTFNQELDIWKQMWHDVVDDLEPATTDHECRALTIQTSLAACEQKLFPNIFLCLYLLMVVPVSTAATERSHSGLQIVKTKLQSTMGQQRLNALMLLYIHKDIQINYPKIIDIYANRYPRRMLFKNPLAEEQEEKQKSM